MATIVETKSIQDNVIIVTGMPDVGLVGAIAASYLIEKLGMEEVGYIDSEKLPPVLVFHEGRPSMPIRIYRHNSIVVILSEVAIPVEVMHDLTNAIVEWAIKKKAKMIINLGGIPDPRRIEVEKPKIVGASTTDNGRKLLEDHEIEVLKEGFLAGIYALIAKESFKKNVLCITLLAQSHLGYPDPGAAAVVLEGLSKILGINIDLEPLLEKAEELRIKLRELMKKALATVKKSQKGYEYATPLMYA